MSKDSEKHNIINRLAEMFYTMHGYDIDEEDYDFSKASHPQEKGMYNLAEAAYEFLVE